MLFENPADCFVLKSAVSDEERATLRDWIAGMIESGMLQPNEAGADRFYAKARALDDVPSLYWQVRERLANRLGLGAFDDDTNLGDLVTCNEPGAQIHKHRDKPDGPGRWHVRVNLYLQAAEQGGEPVLRGQQLDLAESDAWSFIANATEHWSVPTSGGRQRLTCSYAMMVGQPDTTIAKFVLPKPRICIINAQGEPA